MELTDYVRNRRAITTKRDEQALKKGGFPPFSY